MDKDQIESGFSWYRLSLGFNSPRRYRCPTLWCAAIEWYESQIPDGCTPADAKVLRAANHDLAPHCGRRACAWPEAGRRFFAGGAVA